MRQLKLPPNVPELWLVLTLIALVIIAWLVPWK
jgi:hypothetical protein